MVRIMRIMRMLSMLEAAGIFDEIPITMILLICRQQDECGRQDEPMMRSSGSQTAGQSKMPTDQRTHLASILQTTDLCHISHQVKFARSKFAQAGNFWILASLPDWDLWHTADNCDCAQLAQRPCCLSLPFENSEMDWRQVRESNSCLMGSEVPRVPTPLHKMASRYL